MSLKREKKKLDREEEKDGDSLAIRTHFLEKQMAIFSGSKTNRLQDNKKVYTFGQGQFNMVWTPLCYSIHGYRDSRGNVSVSHGTGTPVSWVKVLDMCELSCSLNYIA